MVGNPYTFPITVTLGAIPHLPQWEVSFNPPVLQLGPGGEAAGGDDREARPKTRRSGAAGGPAGDRCGGLLAGQWQAGPAGRFPQGVLPTHPHPPPRRIRRMPRERSASSPTRPRPVSRPAWSSKRATPPPRPSTSRSPSSVGNLGIGLPFTPIGGPHQLSLPPQGGRGRDNLGAALRR